MKSPSKKQKPADVSLTRLIASSFDLTKDSEEFDFIYGYTVSYITKGITAFKYQALLKPYCVGKAFSAKVFRLRLHASKYLALTIKLFMVRISTVKSVDLDFVKSVALELEVPVCDARRLYAIWSDYPKVRSRLKALVREIPSDKKDLLTDKRITEYFNSLYTDVYRYVKFITYSKLRFIAKSSNLELADLHNDILAKVVQSYYSLVPITLPDKHVVNYLKRVAHNHAINIIKTETTQKRGRLVNTGVDHENNRTFSLRVVSENQMLLTPEMAESSYDEIHGEATVNLAKFELEFSVAEILTKLKQRGKKYRLLTILMGSEDEEFTMWLRARNKCSDNEDNIDVQNKISVQDFNMLLSDFLHVSEDKVNVFLFKLRKDLALTETVSTKPTSGNVVSLKRKSA